MTCGFMPLATLQFDTRPQKCIRFGLAIFILSFGRYMYIVAYTLGNHVLQLRSHVVVKLNFLLFIRGYTFPNEYSYSLIIKNIVYKINALLQTACLVVNPKMVVKFTFLFNYTPAGRTSVYMTVPTFCARVFSCMY